MKNSIFIILLGFTTLLFSQQKDQKDLEREARKVVREGNELYNQLKFEEAEIAYKKALDKNPNYAKASYNLANTIYQKNQNKEAVFQYDLAEKIAPDKMSKAEIFHNMGNSFMKEKQYDKAVDAYKNAMRNNSKDEETRYNLAMAQELLKNQQDKDNKDNKDNKDDNKDDKNKDQKDKEGGDKDKKDEKDKDQDKGKDKEDDKGDPKKDKEDPQNQNQKPRPNQLSPEQMKQLLEAMNNEENKTQKKLNAQKAIIVTKIDSLNTALKSVEEEISKLDLDKNLQTVTVIPVKNDVFKHFLEIQGVAKANKNIEISPEMGGTVTAILVKEGQKVQSGQLLIQLDDSSVKNSINELNTQLSLAKTTFERQERLWNQKIGSEMQYLQAKAQKESLENNLSSLRTQARKMRITAPFSGVVDEIFPRLGELTSPQMPTVRLLNLDNVYVEADVTETYLPIIKQGTETVVHFASINKEMNSKISQVGNFINPANRSFKIRIRNSFTRVIG